MFEFESQAKGWRETMGQLRSQSCC